ncbi:MAG: acyl carrier protein [Ruminiclostridium sp.]|nr:acyl carrier protein [Ruminiclostridium sp.]
MNEAFLAKIRENIISHLDIDEDMLADFNDDTIIFNTGDNRPNLGLDSIDSLELVTMIFEVFGYDVPAEDVKKLYSVNAIAAYLNEKGINE